MPGTAVIAGLGPGFCERFAEDLAAEGYTVALLGRSSVYLEEFAEGLRADGYDARALPTDITKPDHVAEAFETIAADLDPVEVLALTASTTTNDDRSGLDPDRFEKMWRLYAHGSLLCFRAAEDDLVETDGTVLFFGALPEGGDIAFKAGKDAAHGLARGLYDEYAPEGVHVAWVQIGGYILNPDVEEMFDDPDPADFLDPESVAETCIHLIDQDRHTQTFEIDLRASPHGLY